MKAHEIRDLTSFEKWLAGLSPTVKDTFAIPIALRAALRSFPLFASQIGSDWIAEWDVSTLSSFRLALTVGTSHQLGREEFTVALVKAQISVNRVATSTSNANDFGPSLGDTTAAATFINGFSLAGVAQRASVVASNSDVAVEYSDGTTGQIWATVRLDAQSAEDGYALLDAPLWLNELPDWFTAADTRAREIWAQDPETWDFWIRWWDGVLSGNQLDWDLQKTVALEIPEDAWSNPKTVAAHIREIEVRFRLSKEADRIEAAVARHPPPSKAQVKSIQAAMERNREALPPTFDAIEGLLLLEIERLQRLNDVDETVLRQLGVQLQLYEAIRELRAQIPEQGPVTEKAAEKSIGLLHLYFAKFQDLPRAKVDDVLEGVYQAGKSVVKLGLIGLSTALGVSYGLPAMGCLAVSAVVIDRKNATEILKAAREVLSSTPKI